MIERGVLSLWTRTPHFRLRRGPLLIQTLALCLANQHFAETQLVTDARGQMLAHRLGWRVSEFSLALDDPSVFDAAGFEHIWALGKLIAAVIQEKPFVQFDGDVLLSQPLPERLLNAPLVAQSPDFTAYYSGADAEAAFAIGERAPGATPYNCGLIGGCDVPLVRAYAWNGLDLALRFRDCALNGTTTSMFIEQFALGLFSERMGVPVTTLCATPLADPDQLHGYAHLTGDLKNEPTRIFAVELTLRHEFPEAYHLFNIGWRALTDRASIEPCCLEAAA